VLRDPGTRIILAELAESAGRANVLWSRAVDVIATDPAWSMKWLAELDVLLRQIVTVEIDDALLAVESVIEAFDRELESVDGEGLQALSDCDESAES
jgi:hypothetical protein